jgi:hypothetical protein
VEEPQPAHDLRTWLTERVRRLSAAAPYRPPTEAERDQAVAAVRTILAGGVPDLDGLGLTYANPLLADQPGTERAWGALVLDARPNAVVEVPHPASDRYTTRLGLELYETMPGAALLIAGAHRDAAGGAADVAHRADSLFHAIATTLGAVLLAVPEIQLHGFAAASAPDTDVVISPGAGRWRPAHDALATALTSQGFRVAHHEHLSGRTNVQGIAAAERGTPFLHLELAPLLRADPRHRAAVVASVERTWHQRRHQHAGHGGARRDQERHPEPGE